MRRHELTFFLLLFCILNAFGQEPNVTVEFSKSSFSTVRFPFDIAFNLIGKAPDDCYRIEYEYSVDKAIEKNRHPKLAKWITLPDRNINTPGKASWKKDGATFKLLCLGMHPNVYYNFKFTIYRNIADNETLKSDLKQKLGAAIQQFFVQLGSKPLEPEDLEKLAEQLQTVVNTKLLGTDTGLRLKQKENDTIDYQLDLYGELQTPINKIFTATSTNKIDADALTDPSTGEGVIKSFLTRFYKERVDFGKAIDAVLNGDMKLNDESKLVLDRPVAPSVDAFKTSTLRNGIMVLKALTASTYKMDLLLKGNAKIVNNDIAEVGPIDPPSIQYIYAVYTALASGQLKTATAAPKNPFEPLADQARLMQEINAKVTEIAFNKSVITTALTEIPDLTTRVVISQTLTAQTINIPDIAATDNAYVSVEAGLEYAFPFQSAMSYAGVNFYFIPVNKQASPWAFRGWNRWGKMLSLSLGYTTLYNDRPLHTYSIFGNDTKSDLTVGLGVRFNQFLKLNFSAIPYRVSHNPLTDSKDFKIGFASGIGLDINLLPLLGAAFTKGVKLTP